MNQSRRLGVARAYVDGQLVDGDVEVVDDRVTGVGRQPAGRRGTAVPGFLDLQINGWAGVDFMATDVDGYRDVAVALARTGTTAWLPTLPTATETTTTAALAVAGQVCRDAPPGAQPLGMHLEGPFLSPIRAGAHPIEALRPISPDLLASYQALAPVRLVTLAPELDGALDLIGELVAQGVVVSVGHSNATADVAHAAFDRGARAHTHVWNAQRPVLARDPGPGAAALTRPDVAPLLIADLVHVAADTLLLSLLAAADRYILTTDASFPAGSEVRGGAAYLPDGTLAGSATSLDAAVRNVVGLGRPLTEALAAVTHRPARLLGDASRGRLVPGARADVVVLDENLCPVLTIVGGDDID